MGLPLIKDEVIENIRQNFPKNLLKEPIWLAYYFKQNKDGTFSKPPVSNKGHTVSDQLPGVTFDEAIKDGFPGIKINSTTPLIAFDIDDKKAKLGERNFSLELLSTEFQDFMMKYDSYTELSPSKCGLRILMNCEDKTILPTKAVLLKELCIGGELFINSGYVTITGNRIAGTCISSITAQQLQPWFKKSLEERRSNVIQMPVKPTIPSYLHVFEALKCCKLDQSDRVKRAYETVFGEEYNHYNYWLKIMASCHHYAVIADEMSSMTAEIVLWSKTDLVSFQSEEDVIQHWSSFSVVESGITFNTLFKLAKLLRFKWPEEAYDAKGNPLGKPMIHSMLNFGYIMSYLHIEISMDIFTGLLYFKADQDIVKKFVKKNYFFGMYGPYTREEIRFLTHDIVQQYGYINIPQSVTAPLFNSYFRHTKRINMLKMWLETSPEELPEDMIEKNTDILKSNLNYLLSCIKLNKTQDAELIKRFFDTFFFEMMMPLYNIERKYSQRSFMLVLTGPENCRKTTFFSMLFPANLRRQFVTNSTETLGGAKSIRDFATSLVMSVLVVTDEFEIFYNKKNDSLFKTYVTSDVVDYVPIYEKTIRKEFKNAVLAGTTNKRSLAFEQDSNRRLAMVDVRFIDTSAMECINWHHFYREYIDRGKKAMLEGLHPWKLSDATIQLQYKLNEEFRAQSNLEIIIKEVFDFDMVTHKELVKYDTGSVQLNKDLCKISDIIGAIRQRYPTYQIKPAELKHILKRLCGNYTGTTNKLEHLSRYKGTIKDGIIKQGQWVRYVMPPRITDFE